MTRIYCFGVTQERAPIVQKWSKKNNVEVTMTSESLTINNVKKVKGYDGVSIAEIAKFNSDIYPKLKEYGIKQLSQRTAGFDYFDLEKAKENGIIITNVPSYSPESIAEFTIMSALQLVRKQKLLADHVAKHDFRWVPEVRGRVLGNMTVAVIGVGRIGLQAAKLFKNFGCTVVGYDPYPKDNVSDVINYKENVQSAIKDADIVTLHMPATDENYHLFNKDMFNKMKKDSYLINAGRGSLINIEDLINALDENKLAAAALDVYEKEATYVPGTYPNKEIKDNDFNKLLHHSKITYTPHCAYYTDESVKNMIYSGLDSTLEVIKTGSSKNRVN